MHFGLVHLFLLPLVFLPKGTIELKLNLFQFPKLFPLFKWITFGGDGFFIIVILVVLGAYLYFKKKPIQNEMIHFAITVIIMGISIYVSKNIAFPHVERPIKFFEHLPQLWNPDDFNIKFRDFLSFPSGHTSSAATLGFFVMRYMSNRWFRGVCYIAILAVGFSRIFLFQHFVIDVFSGVYVGLGCVFLGDWIAYKWGIKTYDQLQKEI